MKSIQILDCTLRDGGYINNWEFNNSVRKDIYNTLINSNIEFVEYGFLSNKVISSSDKTLFASAESVKNKIIMINYGEYDVSLADTSTCIRLAFKLHDISNIENALEIMQKRKIKYSLNPMHISLYNTTDFDKLFNLANKYRPTCITAVDTMGIMDKTDTKNIFTILDKNLNSEINLGFHSHNNLNLSLNNTLTLLELDLNRSIILDSGLDGIGRGGGMLSTNQIALFLNKYYNKEYNIELIDKLSEKYISAINKYDKTPYYLTAINKCHPNYGKYLANNDFTNEEINTLLKLIPAEYKTNYRENVIRHICRYHTHTLV